MSYFLHQGEHKYILDEHGNPKPEPDVLVWAKWYEENVSTTCNVKATLLAGSRISVLTFFRGVTAVTGELWETSAASQLRSELNGNAWLDATREQAVARHDKVVAAIKSYLIGNEVNWDTL